MVGATAGSVGLYTESAAGFVPVLLLSGGGADFLPQPVVAISKMTRKVAAVLIFVLIIFAFQSWVTVYFPLTMRTLSIAMFRVFAGMEGVPWSFTRAKQRDVDE